MKTVLLSALLLSAFTSAPAQMAPKPLTKQSSYTAPELIKMTQELIDALARGDKSVADRIYADDFVRITTQGGVLTKTQVLGALKVPEDGVKISYESKDIRVFEYGNAAVMVYL